MTMTSYPFNTRATTDAEYSRLAREWADDGVLASIGAADLRIGPPAAGTTGLVSAMQAGNAVLRGFLFRSTALENISHPQANTAARIDRVVLRLNLDAPIGERIIPAVVAGTPGTTPTLPPLASADTPGIVELGLSRVSVSANFSGPFTSAHYTEDRSFSSLELGVWTTAKRPVNPRKYTLGRNETLGVWEFWDGDSWELLVPKPDWNDVQNKPARYPDSDKIGGRTIFVQPDQPGGVDGDIWIKI